MDADLSQAYYGVYSSSKEILKNNQRHLFCNMLDLLRSACKTTGVLGNKSFMDEQVFFWMTNILPLIFDQDCQIQSSAIAALKEFLTVMDASTIHNSKHWADIKKTITTQYTTRINKIRDEKNSNWYHIWCLLIQIFDKEILKGASTINSFLSIVELSFRSTDNTVRIEAFACWRYLIQVFAAYGELCSPKRMKLICIPLKSSQSKSPLAASVKLRVWWYLISCLGEDLEKYFDIVVEPFLVFCFGPSTRSMSKAIDHQQDVSVRELALPCLVSLLIAEPSEFLDTILNQYKLEHLSQPSPLLAPSFSHQHGKMLFNASTEALNVLFENKSTLSDDEQGLLALLMQSLLRSMQHLDVAQLCDELTRMLPSRACVVDSFLRAFAQKGLRLTHESTNDSENYSTLLNALIKLVIAARGVVPQDTIQQCVEQVLTVDSLRSGRRILSTVFTEVVGKEETDLEVFKIKLLFWCRLSQQLICMNKVLKDFSHKEDSKQLENWILWPIKMCLHFGVQCKSVVSTTNICSVWSQFLQAVAVHTKDKRDAVNEVNELLRQLLEVHLEETDLIDLINGYVTAVVKLDMSKDIACHMKMFALLNDFLNVSSALATEACLRIIQKVIVDMKQRDITSLFDLIKSTLELAASQALKRGISSTFIADWKRQVLDKMRSNANAQYVEQIKGLFKNNDVFVIIPSVWSLNPEKLTERQKERLSEKSDIPALYNDMSQSQDESIQPWTPKKIVIAKGEQNEIALTKQTPDVQPVNSQQRNGDELEYSSQASVIQIPKSIANKSLRSATKAKDTLKTECAAMGKSIIQPNPVVAQNVSPNKNEEKMHVESSVLKWSRRPCTRNKQRVEAINKTAEKSPQTTTSEKEPLEHKNDEKDKITPEKQKQTETVVEVVELNNQITEKPHVPPADNRKEQPMEQDPLGDNLNIVHSNVQNIREISPKKTIAKCTPLSSPPDRKLTNSHSSPMLRPKPPTYLTGRGAQLINMIRNKKNDHTSTIVHSTPTSRAHMCSNFGMNDERTDATLPPCDLDNCAEQAEAKQSVSLSSSTQLNNLLTFTKRLPSPSASPSASILKRKLPYEFVEDVHETPSGFKRKRVSFHDPPVSLTKEYVRDVEHGQKLQSKRCLNLDKNVNADQSAEPKYELKRRSKLDSILEIERYTSEQCNKSTANTSTSLTPKIATTTNVEQDILMKETSPFVATNEQHDSIVAPTTNAADVTKEPLMTIDTALNFLKENTTFDIILQQYFSTDNAMTLATGNIIAKFLSKNMNENMKIKENVLESLCENHSKEFLDYAIQENLSSVVCDRLNLNSVIDYVCAKSKLNTNCRNNLLEQIPDILKQSKYESDRLQFIKTILQQTTCTDEQILDLMAILLQKRASHHTENCEKHVVADVSVSESAIDSSSNL